VATEAQIAARRIHSCNPATGEMLREVPCQSDAEVNRAVHRARQAQPAWNALGISKRVGALRNFQRLLHARKTEIARSITQEAGKPVAEALLTEVLVVLDAVRFCAENARAFLREETVPHASLAMKAKSGRILREPYGVIGIISPWNYPFSIPATESLSALVMGNAVVLKPSELTPLIALELASLLHEAGVPDDIFQVVPGDGITGAALVNSPIDKLVFTGSVTTGKRIAQAAAARLLPVVLELGGKDPMIVLDDADVDIASSAAVWGAFVNAGQACLSVERCYVHRRICQKFTEACVAKTKRLRVGNGLDPQTDIGPLIHERQLCIVEAQIEDARGKGSRVLAGGERLAHLGANFYAPTVLADVNHSMTIMREETFGPVLPIMPFDSDEEAIQLANDSHYGLAASVWTKNLSRGEAIARKIQSGTVMINDAISCFGISEAPHGGVKSSGIGRTHGKYGFEEMVRIKYLDADRLPKVKKLWWYGYGAAFTRQMESFVDMQFAQSSAQRLRGALRTLGLIRRKEQL
jgi:succinate-semialdehyde dehydrogenase/glutarate-semialdehyde dehydrogenase